MKPGRSCVSPRLFICTYDRCWGKVLSTRHLLCSSQLAFFRLCQLCEFEPKFHKSYKFSKNKLFLSYQRQQQTYAFYCYLTLSQRVQSLSFLCTGVSFSFMEPRLCLHLALEIKIPNLPDSGNSPKVITSFTTLPILIQV